MRLPDRLWAVDDCVQPVQPLVPPGLLAQAARRLGGCRRGDEEHRHRQHLRQGAAGRVRCKRGHSAQAISRSRGGWTTKVHALTDVIGRPYALMLPPPTPATRKPPPPPSNKRGAACLLPPKRLRRPPAAAVPPGPFPRSLPRRRNRHPPDRQPLHHRGTLQAFCRLKDFRRVHTRYDKLAANFLSGVALATAIAFWL